MSNDFDIFDFMDSRAYPKADIPLIIDEQAGYELLRLQEKVDALKKRANTVTGKDRIALTEEIETLKAQQKEIAEGAKKSALVVTLQGVSQERMRAVFSDNGKSPETDELDVESVTGLLAIMLVRITMPTGKVDERAWDEESVKRFIQKLPPQSQARLFEETTKLIMASLAFDKESDTGFLVTF